MYIIYKTCFDEYSLVHVITGRHYFYINLVFPTGLVQSSCCCVLWSKSFERGLHFMPFIYKMSKINLPFFIFSWKIICVDSLSVTLFHFVNTHIFLYKWNFKTQKLSGGMFSIKSCNQIFMTCAYLYKLLLTRENKNFWHILYKQWLYTNIIKFQKITLNSS